MTVLQMMRAGALRSPVLAVSPWLKDRADQANRNAILSLVNVGVLEPYGGERHGRLYWNRRVFQIIEA